jgi:hypothetical protein
MTLLLVTLIAGGCESSQPQRPFVSEKRTIGATAVITDKATGVAIPARVDTGAHTCSIDAERVQITDEADDPTSNIGKRVRFLMRGGHDQTDWVESTITGQATVRTADEKEAVRYEIHLTLQWKEFEKEVAVTLNDRSELAYPMLLGRNFLIDDFVVDVSLNPSDAAPREL